MSIKKQGPLGCLKIIEFAGIGPAPMCGMLLSDLGAEVLRIDRPEEADVGIKRPLETNFILRGRRTVKLDLKNPQSIDLVLKLVEQADCIIEGFRPGVMERLGLGPDRCLERNPALVYGRVTGWGQDGPLSSQAGHDLNYIALTGALDALGREGEKPAVPLNLIGDFAGGALFLALGLLAAVLEARGSGEGQVVDAAIVDGVSSMLTSINGLRAAGLFASTRGTNILDSGAYFYDVYRCADGGHIAVGAIEKRFFSIFLERLGLNREQMPAQDDREGWSEGRRRLQAVFEGRPRDHWVRLFADSDACVSPVLSIEESFNDPHMQARKIYEDIGGFTQSRPAPRFSRTPPGAPTPPRGAQGLEALSAWEVDAATRDLARAVIRHG
ncbi:CaiB/BaiF CoA-transferase family protein [Mesorhizobium sp. 1M-11]|uniref:CaiB/BaiF CoA transferase family protein n=1 Tax=Mesorhizobium sp. 1M-11 TaxID=1529006 RepID=UPI0006C754B0|nr:CaiB/BaiF CoA-transferase family protein [Mesorhizobium sp. 1M-11]